MRNKTTIPFTEDDVKKHLDNLIKYWRKKRGDEMKIGETASHDFTAILIAQCYIDAYQSIRKNLFGMILPIDIEKSR